MRISHRRQPGQGSKSRGVSKWGSHSSAGHIQHGERLLLHANGVQIFRWVQNQKAQKLVKKGERPPLSEEVEHSKDPAIQHIVQGMRRAQAQNAEDRPPAREIAKYLVEALKSIAGTDNIAL